MLYTARVGFRELLETRDARDIRHAEMPRRDHQRIERLLPPVVVLTGLLLPSEGQHPLVCTRILLCSLHGRPVLHEILVPVAVEQIFHVLPDDGVVPKRRVWPVQADRVR